MAKNILFIVFENSIKIAGNNFKIPRAVQILNYSSFTRFLFLLCDWEKTYEHLCINLHCIVIKDLTINWPAVSQTQ